MKKILALAALLIAVLACAAPLSAQIKKSTTAPTVSVKIPAKPPTGVGELGAWIVVVKETVKTPEVEVRVTGTITVGSYAGSCNAEGIKGFKGMFLTGYNIVPEFPHGCLAFGTDASPDFNPVNGGKFTTPLLTVKNWTPVLSPAGDAFEIGDETPFFLVFVNDNDPRNNSGSFTLSNPDLTGEMYFIYFESLKDNISER